MDLARFPDHFRATFPELVGQRLLVALSGGADSVALLDLLQNEGLALDLEAAHVHHGIRGDEADRDASFCDALCAKLAIPFHLLRIESGTPLTSGREATWRRLRYGALFDLKESGNFDAVATGHHRDDVAEGVLVQMLRGGGPRALAGIAAQTASDVIRPLLPWTREELAGWLREHGIRWREDSSNRDQNLLRNRVRHELLPALEAASPSLRQHLVHLAETLSSTEAHLAHELADRAIWIDPWDPGGGVPTATICELPPPLRTRWLHAQGRMIGLERVTRGQSALFEEMIGTGSPRAVTLGGRWRLRLARGQLWLEPPREPPPFSLSLAPGETIDLALPGWHVRFGDDREPNGTIRWSFRPPPDLRLRVRNPRDGDRVTIE